MSTVTKPKKQPRRRKGKIASARDHSPEELRRINETEPVELGPGSYAVPGAMKAWQQRLKRSDVGPAISGRTDGSSAENGEEADGARSIHIRIPWALRARAEIRILTKPSGRLPNGLFAGSYSTELRSAFGHHEVMVGPLVRWFPTQQMAILMAADRLIDQWQKQGEGSQTAENKRRIDAVIKLLIQWRAKQQPADSPGPTDESAEAGPDGDEKPEWAERKITIPVRRPAYAEILLEKGVDGKWAAHFVTGLDGGGGQHQGPGRTGVKWYAVMERAVEKSAEDILDHWREMLEWHGGGKSGGYYRKHEAAIKAMCGRVGTFLHDWRTTLTAESAQAAGSVLGPASPRPRVSASPLPIEAFAPDTPLCAGDKKRLERLEKVIGQNVQAFVEVGQALAEIRDKRLYRESHDTFDAYCRDRWDFQRAHAYRLIESAAVVKDLDPVAAKLPLPANEAQARALAKVDPDQRVQVWKQVVSAAKRESKGEPRITAAIAEEVVHRWTTPADQLREEKAAEREREREAQSRALPPEQPMPAAAAESPVRPGSAETGGNAEAVPERLVESSRFEAGVEKTRDFWNRLQELKSAILSLYDDYDQDEARSLVDHLRRWADEIQSRRGAKGV
jgi:hypothetical protein